MNKLMEKASYEECKFKVIFFEEADIITDSDPKLDDFETPLT